MFVGKNKDNTSFDEWWAMVVEIYKAGFLDCPVIGFDLGATYEKYVPNANDVERFTTDLRIRMLYEKHYEVGDDPHDAFAAMY